MTRIPTQSDQELMMELQKLFWKFLVMAVLTLVSVEQSSSIETYSLSYSYFDEMAQSYCASVGSGWVFAIRRDCGGVAPTCNDMCNTAKDEILKSISYQRKSVSCFNAFHIMKGHPILRANPSHEQPDAGKVNIGTYGYGAGGCTWTPNHCGPNYCCCKAY